MAQIPPDAGIAAQSRIAVHLAARSHIALFPWLSQDWKTDMIILDETDPNPYPLTSDQLKKFVLEYEAKPTYKIALEQDGYYIFEPDAQKVFPLQQPLEFSATLQLQNFSLAQTDASKAFQKLDPANAPVSPGQRMRVELYWESLAPMAANYAISVRLVTQDGRVLAQDDSWPARGLLSTLQWPVGQEIRDIHYLNVPGGELSQKLHLEVIVYNTETRQPLGPANGYLIAPLYTLP